MYTEEFGFEQLIEEHDSLVWFYVESVQINETDEISPETEFFIDPEKTKLITANVVMKDPLKLTRCDYISFYGLDPVFVYNLNKFPYAKN